MFFFLSVLFHGRHCLLGDQGLFGKSLLHPLTVVSLYCLSCETCYNLNLGLVSLVEVPTTSGLTFLPPLDSQFYFIHSILRFDLFSLTQLSSYFCFVWDILSSILVYFFCVIKCQRVPSTLSVIQIGAEINNRLGI